MNKKILGWILILTLLLGLTACTSAPAQNAGEKAPAAPVGEEAPSPAVTGETYRVAALKGPTAMGLVKLMDQAEKKQETANAYTFSIAASADEITPLLAKGELDMACVPANLASVLYAKTSGAIEVLAVNTLGVLSIMENGETVHSMADLKGKTLVSSGKGSTPEYALRYLLEQNGMDPDTDVTIDWKSEHSECVAALAAGTATLALLPQPFATAAQGKLPGLRAALDLTEEWDALGGESAMITGVIVIRREVAEKNPAAVDAFLQEYAQSVDWVNGHVSEAAALIGSYGIVDAAVAEKALPRCNIVCITGDELQRKLSGYLQVLFDAAPESVGGTLPGADFYYGAES